MYAFITLKTSDALQTQPLNSIFPCLFFRELFTNSLLKDT